MVEHRTAGQLIEALLGERGWSQRTLAIVLGKGETTVNKMIAGKQPVDAETAVMLEEIFDIDAGRFLALQRDYDLALARLAVRPDPKRGIRAFVFGGLPIAEMARRGWITVAGDLRNVFDVETELSRFFGVNRLEDIEVLPHAARRTETNIPVTPAQLAWLYRVKAMASEMLVPRYSPRSLGDALASLRPLLLSPESTRRAPRILMEAGIRFLIVETLPTAKIDGVCFWLNDHSPVVALSLRHDRNDNFWFVLRHELEHIKREHGRTVAIVDDLDGERAGVGDGITEEERQANEAAADFCVSRSQMEAFVARKAPFFSERDMIGFARSLKVHPGIVAGQLQHETGRYERFRQHLAKVRSHILPNALVDGWGDIAPVGQ